MDKMTPTSKRAEEIADTLAKNLWDKIRHVSKTVGGVKPKDIVLEHEHAIAKALEDYAREAVVDNLKRCHTFHCESCHQDQDEFGFPPDECTPGCCCENLRRIKGAAASMREMCAKVADMKNREWDNYLLENAGRGNLVGLNKFIAERIRSLPLDPGNGRGEG